MSLPRAFLLIESGAVVGSGRLVAHDEGLAPVFRAVVRAIPADNRPAPLRTPEQAREGLQFVQKGGRK